MLIKKILSSFLALFFIITLTFFMMKAVPGGPLSDEQPLPESTKRALVNYYGLDQPLYLQYFYYLGNLLQGDLGPSMVYRGLDVSSVILDFFPVSALLGLEALLIAFSFGVLMGLVSAFYQDGWQGKSIFILTTLFISVPSFLLASFLQYLFAIKLNVLPVAKWDGFSYSILPAVSLAVLPSAFIAKQMRRNFLDQLDKDYITMARCKGLTNQRIILMHLLPNSLLPLLAYLGEISVNIITGSFLVEKIFAIPGLGFWLVNCIASRDYPMIMGMTIFYSLILLSFLICGEFLQFTFDPRLRWKRS